ncbi:MAG: DUF4065 domain-containing protein [Muribaculaceae bacterium]|nr:DUF4065 domain-containing protein [Muribaculaceae bacterium]
MAYPVIQIANELLRLAYEGVGELMTNLKLQKMLYYQQGFHLAYFGTPLFDEEIEAWMYGPVVPTMYHEFESYGRNGITPNEDIECDMDDEEWRLFCKVYDMYGKYSAEGLIELTHNESPWQNTPTGKGHVISHKAMKDFFLTRLN